MKMNLYSEAGLRWYDNVEKKETSLVPRGVMRMRVPEKRNCGRPKRRLG